MGSFNKGVTSDFVNMALPADTETYIENVGTGIIEIWVSDTLPVSTSKGVRLRNEDSGLTIALSGSEKLYARTDGGGILAGVF